MHWGSVLKLEMQKWNLLNPSKQLPHKWRRLSPMWQAVSMVGVLLTDVDELLAPYAAKNYEKHLADAKVWIEGTERQEAYAMKKTEKRYL